MSHLTAYSATVLHLQIQVVTRHYANQARHVISSSSLLYEREIKFIPPSHVRGDACCTEVAHGALARWCSAGTFAFLTRVAGTKRLLVHDA